MYEGHSKFVATEVIESKDLRKCKYCQGPIIWLDSKKTSKKYPVNANPNSSNEFGELIVRRNDFHNCDERHATT